MTYPDSPEIAKKTKNNKDARKSPQELYDKYTKNGDEAVIAEDIILAEKHYQYADHYFRLMNDPNQFEIGIDIKRLIPPHPVKKQITQALKGIAAEKAARKEAFRKKLIEVAKAAKAARLEKKDKAAKAITVQERKSIPKKAGNRDKPGVILFLHPMISGTGEEKKN